MNAVGRYPREVLTEKRFKMLFIWPSLILLLFLIGYAFIMVIFYSFFRYSFLRPGTGLEFLGLQNYTFLLTDTYTWERFVFTGKLVAMSVSLQFLIGIGSAYLLQEQFRGRGVILTLVLMPMMLCPIVVGLFWKYMFNTQWGIINYILKTLFDIKPVEWLANESNSIYAVVIADTWMWAPFMTLLSLAAFTAIPKYLYEAASVDRASAWFKFRHITLPLSAPILVLALLFRLIDAIKQFDLVYTLTGGGPGDATQTISFTLYKTAFQYFYTGEGSALALILLITIICLATFLIRYMTSLIEKQQK